MRAESVPAAWGEGGDGLTNRTQTGEAREARLAVSVELALNRMPAVAPERSGVLSGAGASGSLDLPWAHPRIVHGRRMFRSEAEDGSDRRAGREPAHVC